MASMSSPFTLTIDWLAFTLPIGVPKDTINLLGGDWTKSEIGFRGYPRSWMTAGAGRGIGKLGIGAPRAPPRNARRSVSRDCGFLAYREGPHHPAMGSESRRPLQSPRLRLG